MHCTALHEHQPHYMTEQSTKRATTRYTTRHHTALRTLCNTTQPYMTLFHTAIFHVPLHHTPRATLHSTTPHCMSVSTAPPGTNPHLIHTGLRNPPPHGNRPRAPVDGAPPARRNHNLSKCRACATARARGVPNRRGYCRQRHAPRNCAPQTPLLATTYGGCGGAHPMINQVGPRQHASSKQPAPRTLKYLVWATWRCLL